MDYWWGVLVGCAASYLLGSAWTMHQMLDYMGWPEDADDWRGFTLMIAFWPLHTSFLINQIRSLESKQPRGGGVSAASKNH